MTMMVVVMMTTSTTTTMTLMVVVMTMTRIMMEAWRLFKLLRGDSNEGRISGDGDLW